MLEEENEYSASNSESLSILSFAQTDEHVHLLEFEQTLINWLSYIGTNYKKFHRFDFHCDYYCRRGRAKELREL
jgi:hypothetical protein